jgi:hypothetical protein
MASAQQRQIAELTARIAKIERALAQFKRLLIDVVAKALADFRKDEGFLKFLGTYDEDRSYDKGALVVHAGATWVAIGQAQRGSRPGRAPEWKLTAKADGR